MWRLAGYELRKICCRKMVYVSLAFLIFMNVMTYWRLGPSSERCLTAEGEMLEGVEAIRYMQEFDRRYAGVLTDGRAKEIYESSYPPEAVDKAGGDFWYVCPDILQYLDGAFYESGGMGVESLFTPEMGEIHLGYHRGYSMLLFSMINIMLVVGCVIVIAIAPVYAEEYSRGTDALILTARYGKTLEVKAKLAASFLFSSLLCLAVIAVNYILFFMVYGTEGGDTSVQVDFTKRNWEIPYEMDYMQLAGYCVLIWLMASLLLTGITLVVSAFCNTSFTAVVFAAACYVVPVWFSLPGWAAVLMPAHQMLPQGVLNLGCIRIFGREVMSLWIVAGVCAAAMAVSGIWSKKKFAGRQVV